MIIGGLSDILGSAEFYFQIFWGYGLHSSAEHGEYLPGEFSSRWNEMKNNMYRKYSIKPPPSNKPPYSNKPPP